MCEIGELNREINIFTVCMVKYCEVLQAMVMFVGGGVREKYEKGHDFYLSRKNYERKY